MSKIDSFGAVSIINTKPIPWVVDGVNQTEAHENAEFEILAGMTIFITNAKMVKVVNPNNSDDNFEISAVQIIGAPDRWYYQAGAFQRSFGQRVRVLQKNFLVLE